MTLSMASINLVIRRLLLVALFISFPSVAQAQTDKVANWLTIVDAGLAGADLGISMDAFASGQFTEANPILKPLKEHPGWFGFTKATLSAGTLVLVYKYTKPKSKQRYIALISYGILQGVVISLNQHSLSSAKVR